MSHPRDIIAASTSQGLYSTFEIVIPGMLQLVCYNYYIPGVS